MQCILQHQTVNGTTEWLFFQRPVEILEAVSAADVVPVLRQIEERVHQGLSAAGYITYEAAGGLDPSLHTHTPAGAPLLRFGIYPQFEKRKLFPSDGGPFDVYGWEPSLEMPEYAERVRRIKEWIAAGDTYQVNFTMRLRGQFAGSTPAWFTRLFRSQHPRHAAYVEDGEHVFCSASPELFFCLDQENIVCRPMKGTHARGRTGAEDARVAERLATSAKDRAENIMIVDMMRNDLGRIAQTGSVRTEALFAVEQYPTVWQMTSTVRAVTQAGFAEILRALFPCCSITGAPKARTMEIIRDLEPGPRGIYTGTIGCLLPHHPETGRSGRFASFNVAIRTAHIQTATGQVDYGTGGGIVWDSVPEKEYQECQTKALILSQPAVEVALFETLLWRPGVGGYLMEEHEKRIRASARYFHVRFDAEAWRAALDTAVADLPQQRHRVRATLTHTGDIRVETFPLPPGRTVWRVALARQPICQDHIFLYHKTTHRSMYDEIRTQHPEADDVILWNELGQITESCFANVIVRLEGEWWTPPVDCGLLNGVFRQVLVRRRRLRERVFTKEDVNRAERILLINSVRGFIRIELL